MSPLGEKYSGNGYKEQADGEKDGETGDKWDQESSHKWNRGLI